MMTKSIICSIPSIIFLMISVNVHKETKAVCFFNFTKRPIVDDVKRFNLAISNLWIAAACIMELVCIFTLFCIPDSSVFVFMTFAEIVLILGVVASYFKIQKKYKKSEFDGESAFIMQEVLCVLKPGGVYILSDA